MDSEMSPTIEEASPHTFEGADAARGDESTTRTTGLDRDTLLLESADADEGQPRHVRLRRTPVWGAAANSIAFMCIPRSIPACFAATGWPLGVIALLYSSLVTYDTGILLGRVCEWAPAGRCSFPELAAEAAATAAARFGGSARARARWRTAGAWAVAMLQHSCYYLTGVAELIYFEQFCGQLFSFSPLCQWQWLVLVGVLSLPVLQVPSFNASRYAALVLGVLPLVLNVGVFFYEVECLGSKLMSPEESSR